jgi:hypothetical protein
MKDYLHFYIGQWGTLKKSTARHDINYYQDGRYILNGSIYHEIRCFDHEFILELRPLSDMSLEENEERAKININSHNRDESNAAQTAYLLSKGFDVFGLKEKGLAIYKTDVK